MYVLNNVTYFDSFGVEYIPKEIKKFIGNRNIQAIVFRIQANNSVMYGHFCIGFIGFLLKNKNLTDFAHLFSPSDLKKMMIWLWGDGIGGKGSSILGCGWGESVLISITL